MRDIKSDVLLWPPDCGALFYFVLFYFKRLILSEKVMRCRLPA